MLSIHKDTLNHMKITSSAKKKKSDCWKRAMKICRAFKWNKALQVRVSPHRKCSINIYKTWPCLSRSHAIPYDLIHSAKPEQNLAYPLPLRIIQRPAISNSTVSPVFSQILHRYQAPEISYYVVIPWARREIFSYLLPQIVLMSSSETPRPANNGVFHENIRLKGKLQKESNSTIF